VLQTLSTKVNVNALPSLWEENAKKRRIEFPFAAHKTGTGQDEPGQAGAEVYNREKHIAATEELERMKVKVKRPKIIGSEPSIVKTKVAKSLLSFETDANA
jgi:hypothetical protein